ncbi:MAG: hypothetical protein FNP40_15975 [Dehalobacter sp. 4CP]|uniref:hypothetical protein n=1 Tax=Dehalobacter sp. CP TaxID=2594474 RepID=UPI0013CB40B7|nr:hypothetical protein [Dehalobacter sp. 4CP]
MVESRKRTEITAADVNQLGFDYQYLFFIVKLLHLSIGEEVGYEALDDIHIISHHDQKTYFFQLKHTTELNSKGEQANLARFSEDLWKTLSNWSKLISDETEGRREKSDQKVFIDKSNFVFAVNRQIGKNEVLEHIQKLKKKEITDSQFVVYLRKLSAQTQDKTIKQYIKDIIKLGSSVISPFMCHTEFLNTPNILFEQIREGIRDKMIATEYVDDVLGEVFLQLKEDFFNKVQNGTHQVITYFEWINKYQSAFNKYRTTCLPLRTYNPLLPDHLEQQNFVKELIEIGAIDMHDNGLIEIARLTEHYLCIQMQLEDWYQDGKITYSTMQRFNADAAEQWKNIHTSSHRSTKKDYTKDFDNALICFDRIMEQKLSLFSTDLGIPLSNGEFIKLAKEEKIGWKFAWKDRYHVDGK